MKIKIEYLLNDLCVDWGFCIPIIDQKRIIESKQLEADAFACQVLAAESMNPEYETQWRKKIRLKFVEQIGSEYYEG
ncbi:MAG: hypothetical protein OEZ39_16305 [Gammaproteobacteria bacterium]|nr:hypothetical protein [Gammaproteobacteria bacterium]MDH5653422.1 hypothetical protein [Gammaproteobacteria bacterium]